MLKNMQASGDSKYLYPAAGILKEKVPSPKEIFEIATGKITGNKEAAIEAYAQMARAVGDAISNAITMLDGLVVIGGGLAGAGSLFMPFLIDEMKSYFIKQDGTKFRRLVAEIFNLEEEDDRQKFVKQYFTEIPVYGSDKKARYDSSKKLVLEFRKLEQAMQFQLVLIHSPCIN